jgi:enoyl-[acyl-carrier-protein] reductase (NADH)
MGTGKTTIATQLSHRLKMRYISTDDLIEKSQKCTINEIFTRKGEDYFRREMARIPLGRPSEPREIGLLAVYLSSEASDMVTGQNIYIDGGLTGAV